MEAIFNESIAPLIKQAVGSNMFCERSIFSENIIESRLAPLIDKVMSDNRGVYVKSHPKRTHVELHLTITECQKNNPAEKLLKAANQLSVLIQKNGGVVTVKP
jgi:molybdopterin-biosynthesis enzyme MoeA-like protein